MIKASSKRGDNNKLEELLVGWRQTKVHTSPGINSVPSAPMILDKKCVSKFYSFAISLL
jgi:hypothetical protein